MDLHPSTSALQGVLTGCGLPTESPQDAELRGDGGALPMEFRWVQRPGLDFPTPTGGRWPRGGTVTLSCAVMDNGRLRDCRVEREFPGRFSLGQAARRGAQTAQIGLTEAGRAAGRQLGGGRVVFTIEFHTGGD